MMDKKRRFSGPQGWRSCGCLAQLSLLCMVLNIPAAGQNRANVSIDLGKAVNYLTDTSLGVPATTSDGNSFNLAGAPYLRAAGVSAARYPGNHGVADLYHWATRTTTRYKGAGVGYFAPESNFGSFALFAEKLGQAVIVVNYGANIDGTGGGEPAEAAAWVAYVNGDAADTRALGKDSTGEDWRTVGYWATLRGQAPLASDDGLNFLRIQHPRPFGFRLWQIGDEVYNNGYYGGDHTGNPDLHAAAPTGPSDFAKLKNDPKLSPASYAGNLNIFAQAMKSVDPSIHIGAAFTIPPDPSLRTKTYWDKDGEHADTMAWAAVLWGVEWNKEVLKGSCANLDFVTLEWSLQPLLPPDWKTLNESDLLMNTKANFSTIITSMLDDYGKYCPQGHSPKLAFAPAGISSWEKVEHPEVRALWIADTYAMLIESGSVNIDWIEMYGDSMLSGDRKKLGPAYYGLQMLHSLAHNPGDALLDATSNSSLVGVHASLRRDGFVGVMLVNKDLKVPAIVKVSLKNGTVGSAGKRLDYGSAEYGAGAPLTVAPFTATGNELTVTVPPYAVTDILLPGHN
ncbi:MAG: hypothetical protein ABSC48_02085 [Terracidiphilus sp.]|jgi:hypothetical protein